MSSNDKQIIQINNLNKWYGDFHALNNINLTVNEGEIVVICGPSGSGKSTLIRCINYLEKFQEGEIIVDGTSIADDVKKIRQVRSEVSMVFQHFNLFPHLTILDNLTLAPIWVHQNKKEDATERALALLDRVGIKDQAEKYPNQLSGGQQQRVAIARALVMDPDVLLMDEPFAALDAQTRDLLLVEMQLIWEKTKKTILFVTHSVAEAAVLGTKVAVFSNRPSTIKKEVENNFPRPRVSEDESLLKLQQDLLAELRPEVKKNKE